MSRANVFIPIKGLELEQYFQPKTIQEHLFFKSLWVNPTVHARLITMGRDKHISIQVTHTLYTSLFRGLEN